MHRDTDEVAVVPNPLGRPRKIKEITDPRMLPGSPLYEALFERLWDGLISYDEFMHALHEPKRRAE